MNALAMPSSSRIAEDRLAACFCANSPRMLRGALGDRLQHPSLLGGGVVLVRRLHSA